MLLYVVEQIVLDVSDAFLCSKPPFVVRYIHKGKGSHQSQINVDKIALFRTALRVSALRCNHIIQRCFQGHIRQYSYGSRPEVEII